MEDQFWDGEVLQRLVTDPAPTLQPSSTLSIAEINHQKTFQLMISRVLGKRKLKMKSPVSYKYILEGINLIKIINHLARMYASGEHR